MYIHLLSLRLIDGATGVVTPKPPEVAISGGGVIHQKSYQYRYKAEEKLAKLEPEIASSITAQAVSLVSKEASQAEAKRALNDLGISYKQAYQEIFIQLVAEMRYEEEQIAIAVALMI